MDILLSTILPSIVVDIILVVPLQWVTYICLQISQYSCGRGVLTDCFLTCAGSCAFMQIDYVKNSTISLHNRIASVKILLRQNFLLVDSIAKDIIGKNISIKNLTFSCHTRIA